MNLPRHDIRPWYREPWPWLLMSGPAIVVVAGCFTAWLAVRTNDGLVAEDYYKQGLAVNQVLERERRAVDMGVKADVLQSGNQLRVLLHVAGAASMPARMTFTVMHPTQAGKDQAVALAPDGQGFFSGVLARPVEGHWKVTLEDAAGLWRLDGDWQANSEKQQQLVAGQAPAPRPPTSGDKKNGVGTSVRQ